MKAHDKSHWRTSLFSGQRCRRELKKWIKYEQAKCVWRKEANTCEWISTELKPILQRRPHECLLPPLGVILSNVSNVYFTGSPVSSAISIFLFCFVFSPFFYFYFIPNTRMNAWHNETSWCLFFLIFLFVLLFCYLFFLPMFSLYFLFFFIQNNWPGIFFFSLCPFAIVSLFFFSSIFQLNNTTMQFKIRSDNIPRGKMLMTWSELELKASSSFFHDGRLHLRCFAKIASVYAAAVEFEITEDAPLLAPITGDASPHWSSK